MVLSICNVDILQCKLSNSLSQLFWGFLLNSDYGKTILFSSLFLLRFGSILRLLLCHSDYLCLSIQLSIPAIKLSIILSLFSNQLVIKFQPNNVSMSLFSCLLPISLPFIRNNFPFLIAQPFIVDFIEFFLSYFKLCYAKYLCGLFVRNSTYTHIQRMLLFRICHF